MVQREVADRLFAAAQHEGVRRSLGARAARHRAHRLPSRLPDGFPAAAERRLRAGRLPPDPAARRLRRLSRTSSRRRSRTGARLCRTRSTSPAWRPARGPRRRWPQSTATPLSGRKRSSRTSSSRSPQRCDEGARRPGEDQPGAGRRPGTARREARGRDRAPAGRPRRPDFARAGLDASRSTASRRTRSSGTRCSRSRRLRPPSPTGRSGSRRESRSRPASAEEARMPRPRFGSRTRRCRLRCPPNACTTSPRSWARTCRSS